MVKKGGYHFLNWGILYANGKPAKTHSDALEPFDGDAKDFDLSGVNKIVALEDCLELIVGQPVDLGHVSVRIL